MKVIKQKRFSNKTTFEFFEDKLTYTIDHSKGLHSFTIEYASIPVDDIGRLENKQPWFKNLGILWIGVGLLQTFVRFIYSHTVQISWWLLVGGVFFILYPVVRTKFTVLRTEAGGILIIKDKRHDQIFDEIKTRKRQQLRDWHGEINYDNSPESEIDKFVWLKNQDVITEDELEEIRMKITFFHSSNSAGFTMELDEKKLN